MKKDFLRSVAMKVKRICLSVVLVGMAFTGWGCRPNIVGSDAGVYSVGVLYAAASADLTSVYDASVKAMSDLEIEVTDKAKDVFSAKVIGRAADGKIIMVNMKPATSDTSELSIKAGAFGDEHRSRVIYDQIKKNLGK
jgi:hypothetical protein